jgi:hypothetical protein
VIPAHILGIPVEETFQALAPVAAVTVVVVAVAARVHLNRARRHVGKIRRGASRDVGSGSRAST